MPDLVLSDHEFRELLDLLDPFSDLDQEVPHDVLEGYWNFDLTGEEGDL